MFVAYPLSFFLIFLTLWMIIPLTIAFLLNELSSAGWKASTESPMVNSSSGAGAAET